MKCLGDVSASIPRPRVGEPVALVVKCPGRRDGNAAQRVNNNAVCVECTGRKKDSSRIIGQYYSHRVGMTWGR